MGEFKDVFEAGFLPASIDIRLREELRDPQTVRDVADRVRDMGLVEDVRYGEDWITKLYRIRNIAAAAGMILGIAFAAVAIIIIGATIRMTVLARSREISIMRLVGATDGFVRRPFLLEGFAKGVLGGALALLLTWGRQFAHFARVHPDRFLPGFAGAARDSGRRPDRRSGQRPVGGAPSAPGAVRPWRSSSRSCSCVPVGAHAQSADDRLRQQREELDRIRRERDSLRTRMTEMQGRVHDLSDEVTNLRRQADATSRLVKSLDQQLVSLDDEVKAANDRVAQAETEVEARRGTLKKRVADIYKRGPLFATEALLSARSFGELVARYKYLHELALYDRAVVRRVEDLHDQIDSQRQLLVRLQDEFARNRQEKAIEEQRLRDLETQRQRSLAQAKQSTQQIQDRLTRIQRDESAAVAADRLAGGSAAPRRGGAPGGRGAATSTLKTSDFGNLDWPVDGDILYQFGRAVNPEQHRDPLERHRDRGADGHAGARHRGGRGHHGRPDRTYGLTVIVQHGGGDYSVYGSLSRADVQKGAAVQRGQVIGAVGRADPDMEPHLHFEIRPKGRATDPLAWLRAKRM